MNLSAFDLNLLVVFEAMMVERSVTRAAQRVNLSQPAVSHALNRLRHLFKDELFVRGPDGMQPTARALEMAGPVRHALTEIQSAIDGAVFEPSTSRRRFHVAVQNHAGIVLLPSLVDRLREGAPGVELRFLPAQSDDVLDGLEKGRLDLATGHFPTVPDRFGHEVLLDDSLVCVLRSDHPLAGSTLTLDSYTAMPHLVISIDGSEEDAISRLLGERGLSRRVALTVPHFMAAAIGLARSDMVATMSRRMAEAFAQNSMLRVLALPFTPPGERVSMIWHHRLAGHPAQIWLRHLFADTAKVVRETSGTGDAAPTAAVGAGKG